MREKIEKAKDTIMDITMSCEPHETLRTLRSIVKAEKTELYPDKNTIIACYELIEEIETHQGKKTI